MFWAIYGVVFFAGLAMMVREGLWSNTISLFNIIISGLVAFGYYAPLTSWLDGQLGGGFTYVLDFVVVWALFVVTTLLCRTMTKVASKTRMRFKHPIDPVGGPIIALVAAWVLSSFTMATLIMAPMPVNGFGNRIEKVEELMGGAGGSSDSSLTTPLVAPDVAWLSFVERMSNSQSFGPGGGRAFGNKAYVTIYHQHREKLEKAKAPWLRVSR